VPGDGANGAREIEIEIERIRARLAANEFERKDLQTRLDDLLSRRSTTSLEICKETIVGDALMVSASSPDSRSSRPMLSLSIWPGVRKSSFLSRRPSVRAAPAASSTCCSPTTPLRPPPPRPALASPIARRGVCSTGSSRWAPCANSPDATFSGSMAYEPRQRRPSRPRPLRPAEGDALARMMMRAEAAIFASARPVARETLAGLVGDACRLDALIADINEELKARPYEIVFVAGGFQFRTRPRPRRDPTRAQRDKGWWAAVVHKARNAGALGHRLSAASHQR
jgi:hypothetical protein